MSQSTEYSSPVLTTLLTSLTETTSIESSSLALVEPLASPSTETQETKTQLLDLTSPVDHVDNAESDYSPREKFSEIDDEDENDRKIGEVDEIDSDDDIDQYYDSKNLEKYVEELGKKTKYQKVIDIYKRASDELKKSETHTTQTTETIKKDCPLTEKKIDAQLPIQDFPGSDSNAQVPIIEKRWSEIMRKYYLELDSYIRDKKINFRVAEVLDKVFLDCHNCGYWWPAYEMPDVDSVVTMDDDSACIVICHGLLTMNIELNDTEIFENAKKRLHLKRDQTKKINELKKDGKVLSEEDEQKYEKQIDDLNTKIALRELQLTGDDIEDDYPDADDYAQFND